MTKVCVQLKFGFKPTLQTNKQWVMKYYDLKHRKKKSMHVWLYYKCWIDLPYDAIIYCSMSGYVSKSNLWFVTVCFTEWNRIFTHMRDEAHHKPYRGHLYSFGLMYRRLLKQSSILDMQPQPIYKAVFMQGTFTLFLNDFFVQVRQWTSYVVEATSLCHPLTWY